MKPAVSDHPNPDLFFWTEVAVMCRKGSVVLLFLGFLLATVVAGLYVWMREKAAVEQMRTTGRLSVDRVMLSVHLQAMAFKENEREHGFLNLLKRLDEELKQQQHTFRFISSDPSIKQEQPQGTFERELLARFAHVDDGKAADVAEQPFAEWRVADRQEYRYYQPVFAKKGCFIMCHAPTGVAAQSDPVPSPFGRAAPGDKEWKDGELMAVVEIAVPRSP
jgi:hypothetical protein